MATGSTAARPWSSSPWRLVGPAQDDYACRSSTTLPATPRVGSSSRPWRRAAASTPTAGPPTGGWPSWATRPCHAPRTLAGRRRGPRRHLVSCPPAISSLKNSPQEPTEASPASICRSISAELVSCFNRRRTPLAAFRHSSGSAASNRPRPTTTSMRSAHAHTLCPTPQCRRAQTQRSGADENECGFKGAWGACDKRSWNV